MDTYLRDGDLGLLQDTGGLGVLGHKLLAVAAPWGVKFDSNNFMFLQ